MLETYNMGFYVVQSLPIPPYNDRQLIPHAIAIGTNLYFYGITRKCGAQQYKPFAFINFFDTVSENFRKPSCSLKTDN